MKTIYVKRNSRVTVFMLVCSLLISQVIGMVMPMSVMAAEEGKQLVKVGYFASGGYYKTGDNGKLIGYDADYLTAISQISDFKFEYVDCGTWINATEMLAAGEIDLVGATQWNAQREEQFEFCLEDYGHTIGELVVLPDTDVAYEDYDAIGRMKIGCLFNYVHRKELDDKLKEQNLAPEIVTFQTQTELTSALKDGTVDAIASNSHLMDQSWQVVEKFSYSPYYFIAQKGNTALTDQLDAALIQINMDHTGFDDQLVETYFPTLNNNQLTEAEQSYINSLDGLTFCFCTNEGFLCRTEDGAYEGINPAIAKRVCEILGVQYKEIQFDFPELIQSLSGITDGTQSAAALVERVKNMGINVWGDFYYDQAWADTLGVGITEAYMDAAYYEIQKKGVSVDDASCKVAAVRGLRYTADIVNQYEQEQIVWCDDFESCIKAVKAGMADRTVINTLAAEYYLSMFQYNDLSATLIDFVNQSCMATIDDPDGLLASALNKTIQSISVEEMNALVRTETAKSPEQNMLIAYFYTHTLTAIVLLMIVVVSILAFATMIYNVQKNSRQNELLRQATNAKSDFLARMSHDIRTPMNAIINLTSMVENEIDDKDKALKDIQKIKNANEFLLALINDVLDISRIEQGKLILNRQLYNDTEFFEYMHATFDMLCGRKNITFKIESGDYEAVVMTDRVRFNQICFNIVSNAVKYTPEGGHIILKLSYQPVINGQLPVDIYVIDDGIGMSEEFISRAFNAFEQENRQFMTVEGTGLGLSIVKQIVDVMGGTIEIHSQLEKGTTVHVHLDMELADQTTIAAGRTEETRRQEMANISGKTSWAVLQGKNILVAEDHPMNMQIAVRLLEKKGMKVIQAADGDQAVKLFQDYAETIDAILMDIRMPVMNGLEAAAAIRTLSLPQAKNVPIIALTANAYVEDIEKSKASGMNAHLAKPIDPEVLYETLAMYIQGRLK